MITFLAPYPYIEAKLETYSPLWGNEQNYGDKLIVKRAINGTQRTYATLRNNIELKFEFVMPHKDMELLDRYLTHYIGSKFQIIWDGRMYVVHLKDPTLSYTRNLAHSSTILTFRGKTLP